MSAVIYSKAEARERVLDLQLRYAHAIDEDRLEQWPTFFAESCRYRVIPRENHARGLPACLIDCRGRAMLVGDLDDPKSEIRQLLARRKNKTLKPEAGTKPRVFYLT